MFILDVGKHKTKNSSSIFRERDKRNTVIVELTWENTYELMTDITFWAMLAVFVIGTIPRQ